MSELIPKIADISTLKGISMLIALPMLCVAYVFQTGLEINIDGDVWLALQPDDTERWSTFKLFFIFTVKSLWVAGIASVCYIFVTYAQRAWEFPFLYITSVVLIAIALLGIFGQKKFPQLEKIEIFWFYSFMVWGVFLQTITDEINKK